jgi:hypothetical protein
VAEFYQWYVPAVLAKPSLDLALGERPNAFSDSLRAALAMDSLARSRVVGEIDGLDWDPYLGGQDPFERYEVGQGSRLDDSTDAFEIFPVRDGIRDTVPSMVATVRTQGQQHHFVDFRSPGDSLSLIDHIMLLHPKGEAKP